MLSVRWIPTDPCQFNDVKQKNIWSGQSRSIKTSFWLTRWFKGDCHELPWKASFLCLCNPHHGNRRGKRIRTPQGAIPWVNMDWIGERVVDGCFHLSSLPKEGMKDVFTKSSVAGPIHYNFIGKFCTVMISMHRVPFILNCCGRSPHRHNNPNQTHNENLLMNQ